MTRGVRRDERRNRSLPRVPLGPLHPCSGRPCETPNASHANPLDQPGVALLAGFDESSAVYDSRHRRRPAVSRDGGRAAGDRRIAFFLLLLLRTGFGWLVWPASLFRCIA